MACIAAPKIPYPPGLSALLPPLVLTVPPAGIKFCCTFETPPIPGTPIVLPLGAIAPGIALILQPYVTVIMAAIDQINTLLDQVQASCPLE